MPLQDLKAHLAALVQPVISAPIERKIGRPSIVDHEPASSLERVRKHRAKKTAAKARNIAVLDFETDPFDNQSKDKILPFVCELYSDQFEPVVIWDENFDNLITRIVSALEALPEPFIIYAHNGGKFDWMFLLHVIRGDVSFKGRAIMSAKLGRHELRDSLHIIPEKLSAYHKDEFDYQWMKRNNRKKYKQQILDYLHSDCVYLFQIVKAFITDFGLKLSIGQAATLEVKKHYEIARFSDSWDEFMRQFFFGGRVECIAGAGEFTGPYRLYDINSAYPRAMAYCAHPVGSMRDYDMRLGQPNEQTCFIDLDCVNHGALISRDEMGNTTAQIREGNFKTTIWEYDMAIKYGLIENVVINYCVDCSERTTFEKFVIPHYEKRLQTKKWLGEHAGEDSAEFFEVKKDDIFIKLLLNNAYGKQAQNPRRFKEHYLTDPDEMPPREWFKSIDKMPADLRGPYQHPAEEFPHYWIWSKPAPGFHFNNVGTAASITGATRAQLMEAIHLAKSPIYCDTDSLICLDLPGVEIHKEKLGAWDIEDKFVKVAIAAKKLYAGWYEKPKILKNGLLSEYKLRSKGVEGVTYTELLRMIAGETIEKKAKGVTIYRDGSQDYMIRNIRATAPRIIT